MMMMKSKKLFFRFRFSRQPAEKENRNASSILIGCIASTTTICVTQTSSLCASSTRYWLALYKNKAKTRTSERQQIAFKLLSFCCCCCCANRNPK